MAKPADDFEAVRLVIEALEPFDAKARERIIRWASEKLGMSATPLAALGGSAFTLPQTPKAAPAVSASSSKDIKSFVLQKNPRSDNQMAAVVAYFHHFEAPPNERKESIGKEELIDACRKSERSRPARPQQVLVNTYAAGLFDKAGSPGQYRLNSVGENLVAMVLPEQANSTSAISNKARKNKPKAKKKAKVKSK